MNYHQQQQRHLTQHHHTQQHNIVPQQTLRLKCIVLGSAGAGKTSLLRRYVHGTFEAAECHDYRKAQSRRAGRGRKSPTPTLGADYYVKKVPNPFYGTGEASQACCCFGYPVNSEPDECDIGDDKNARNRFVKTEVTQYEHDEKSSSKYSQSHSTKNQALASPTTRLNTESHNMLLQLWDTVGNERLSPSDYLHRINGKDNRFNHNFEHFLMHQEREKIKNNSSFHHRHRNRHFPTRSLHTYPSSQFNHNEPAGGALFCNIDACMLVYDSTSSLSFLQLMQWYVEWGRMSNAFGPGEDMVMTMQPKGGEDEMITRISERRKRVPFIVVANKVDLLKERQNELQLNKNMSKRRSVLGLHKRGFTGKDYKYEYSVDHNIAHHFFDDVENPSGCRETPSNSTVFPNQNCRCSHQSFHNMQTCSRPHAGPMSTASVSGTANNSSTTKSFKNSNKLSYSLKETAWSNDTSYLHSLQVIEDELPANRKLILLWCQRNGIPHVETSALDGTGVDEAFNQLIVMGMHEVAKQEVGTSSKQIAVEELKEGVFENEAIERDIEKKFREGTNYTSNTSILKDADGSSTKNSGENVIQDSIRLSKSKDDSRLAHNDPSKNYFLYHPRREAKLDLFSRYSTKDETRCFPSCCWLPFFSGCLR